MNLNLGTRKLVWQTKNDALKKDERHYSQLLNPKTKIIEIKKLKQESLEKVLKIELIKDLTSEEIKLIGSSIIGKQNIALQQRYLQKNLINDEWELPL